MNGVAHLFLFHSGKIRTHGIGGGHKRRYRWVDFQRLRYEPEREAKPFEEKVVEVRYDPCRLDKPLPHTTLFTICNNDHEHTVDPPDVFVCTGPLTLLWWLGAPGRDGSSQQRTCRLETSLKHLELSDVWQVKDARPDSST